MKAKLCKMVVYPSNIPIAGIRWAPKSTEVYFHPWNTQYLAGTFSVFGDYVRQFVQHACSIDTITCSVVVQYRR